MGNTDYASTRTPDLVKHASAVVWCSVNFRSARFLSVSEVLSRVISKLNSERLQTGQTRAKYSRDYRPDARNIDVILNMDSVASHESRMYVREYILGKKWHTRLRERPSLSHLRYANASGVATTKTYHETHERAVPDTHLKASAIAF